MIKLLLKHYIWEMCIGVLFNKISTNFISNEYIFPMYNVDGKTTYKILSELHGKVEAKEITGYVDNEWKSLDYGNNNGWLSGIAKCKWLLFDIRQI